MKLILTNLHIACPTVWKGKDDDGNEIYIKYRFGDLRVDANDITILSKTVGDEFDGFMTNEELKTHLPWELEFLNGEFDHGNTPEAIDAQIAWLKKAVDQRNKDKN